MIWNRVTMAFKKLAFCLTVSADFATSWKIILNTKRYAWSKRDNRSTSHDPDSAGKYSVRLVSTDRQVFLRTSAGDIQIFYDVFWRQIYRLPGDTIFNARTIVDLGAHVGLATLYFSLNARQAKIYAVEPDESNLSLLMRNLESEIESRKVIPIHAAIAENTATKYLQKSAFGFNTNVTDSPTSLSVAGIEIKEFFERWRIEDIDILKVDIEGAESFLFSGDSSWLQNVRNIIIEIHSPEKFIQFQAAIENYSFTIKKLQADYEDIYWAYR